MVRQSTSSNKDQPSSWSPVAVNPPVAPQPSVTITQEPIVQELRALVKTQHKINEHLWWLSFSVKFGIFMMAFWLLIVFFVLLVNDI